MCAQEQSAVWITPAIGALCDAILQLASSDFHSWKQNKTLQADLALVDAQLQQQRQLLRLKWDYLQYRDILMAIYKKQLHWGVSVLKNYRLL